MELQHPDLHDLYGQTLIKGEKTVFFQITSASTSLKNHVNSSNNAHDLHCRMRRMDNRAHSLCSRHKTVKQEKPHFSNDIYEVQIRISFRIREKRNGKLHEINANY